MKKHTFLKVFSVITVFAIILCASATPIFALENQTAVNNDYVQENYQLSPYINSNLSVKQNDNEYITEGFEIIEGEREGTVVEVEELREEYVKHFSLPNGTYEAVVYPEPVHVKDSNGQWQDVNNALSLKTDGNKNVYATADNRLSFAQNVLANQDIFSLSENGYSISMSLVPQKATLDKDIVLEEESSLSVSKDITMNMPSITNSPARATKFDTIDQAINIDNKSSITYFNVSADTDIEYVIGTRSIKENIIVKNKKSDYTYSFAINVDGLYAELYNDGSIKFYDAINNNPQYVIPSPYMYDAEGNISYNVQYSLSLVGKNQYSLTVSADKTWINSQDRVFPVTIDPSLTSYSTAYDTYIDPSSATSNFGNANPLILDGDNIVYMKMDFPELPEGSTLGTVFYCVSYYFPDGTTDETMDADIYEISQSWDANTLTWNSSAQLGNNRGLSEAAYDTTRFSTGSSTRSIRITSLARDWYNGTKTNNGIALKYNSGYSCVMLNSAETEGTSAPYYRISYTRYVPDGIYFIQNVGNVYQWLEIPAAWDNGEIKTDDYNHVAGPYVYEMHRATLFKISRVSSTDRYVIRTMQNNLLTLSEADGTYVTKKIPADDAAVQITDTFYINFDGENVTIRQYGSDNFLTTSSTATTYPTDVTVSDEETFSDYSKWSLKKYTCPETWCGAEWSAPPDLNAGELVSYIPTMWSSEINANQPYMYMSSESQYTYATGTWHSEENIFEVTPHILPQFSFYVEILTPEGTAICSVLETRQVTVPIPDGEYYIQNAQHGLFMQTDTTLATSIIMAGDFGYHNFQTWNITHWRDGYYKIQSKLSNLALTYQNETYDSSGSLSQQLYNGLYNQIWKLELTERGTYIIRNRISETYETDWCAAMTGMTGQHEHNIVQQNAYVSDYNYNDEWGFYNTQEYYGTVSHWHNDSDEVRYLSTPITYYLDDKIEDGGIFAQICDNAIAEWAQALDIEITKSTSKNNAQIKIERLSESAYRQKEAEKGTSDSYGFAVSENDAYTGYVVYNNEIKHIVSCTGYQIYILYREVSNNENRKVILHEFGHSIGYTGHSIDPKDIMYTIYSDQSTDLTAGEINHVRQIYDLIYG
ncbi:MAG: DNRLRE domain-containing protein [Ruminococcaceae bacterium]|nr:DNRLRE domain-containing protein [Oscillospiraceae bacterium]